MIAAIGENNALGKDNGLLWHLPNDLKFFKEQTKGGIVVMGKNTWHSLGRPLPNRRNIVISRTLDDNVETYRSLEELEQALPEEMVWCIGGASLYAQMLDMAEELVLTEVEDSPEADVFFPAFNKDEWEKTELAKNEDNGIQYKHARYVRK